MRAIGHVGLQRISDDTIGTERRRELVRSLRPRRRDVARNFASTSSLAGSRSRRPSSADRIGIDEEIDRAVARGLTGIGVDLHQRVWQPRRAVAGLLPRSREPTRS
jgi:hypothetical protein